MAITKRATSAEIGQPFRAPSGVVLLGTGGLSARLATVVNGGPPTTGTWRKGDVALDVTGGLWTCTVAGAPGTWVRSAGPGSGLPAGGALNSVLVGPGSSPQWAPFWFNVKAYGALGNGVHDDTAAINSAVSAAVAAGGGVVYFPAGTYSISSGLTITGPVTFLGDGMGATTIQSTVANPSFALLTLTGAQPRVSAFTLNGRGTSGAVNAPGITTGVGTNCTHYEIDHVEVATTQSDGIQAYGSYGHVHHNYVHDCWRNGIYSIGIAAGGPTQYVEVDHNIAVNNSSGSTTWDGLDVDPSCQHFSVHHNLIVGNDIIVFDNGAGQTFDVIVEGNISVNSNENGIDIATTASGVIVANNTIYSATGYGILINGGVTRFELRGNQIIGSSLDGIYIPGAAATSFLIEDNFIENPSSVSGAGSGITVKGGSGGGSIRGNYVRDTRGTALMAYAIDVGSAVGPLDVSGNLVNAGVSGTIRRLASANATHHDNLGYNPVGSITIAAPASGATYTNATGLKLRIALTTTGAISALTVAGTAWPASLPLFDLEMGETFTPTYTGVLTVTALAK